MVNILLTWIHLIYIQDFILYLVLQFDDIFQALHQN